MLNKEQRPLRIYVCGPYTASTGYNVEKNVRKAIDVGLALFKKGHFPFIPHLTHYVDIRGKERNNAPTWIEYMDRDLAWLQVSDALYFIGRSRGADIELEAAFEWDLDIYYTISDVPDVSTKIRR
jgi:hypothetical protein